MRDNPINALRETLAMRLRLSQEPSGEPLRLGLRRVRRPDGEPLSLGLPLSGARAIQLQLSAPATVFRASRFRLRSPRRVPGRDDGAPGGAVAADHGPDQLAAGSPRRQHLDDRHRQPRHRHSRVLAGARQGGQFQYQGADRDPRTRILRLFGVDKIASLLADREFIGDAWLAWLQEKAIPFHIRIRSNIKIANTRGRMVKARELFRDLKPGESRILSNARRLSEARKPKARPVFVAAIDQVGETLKTGELLIVVTNDAPEEALAIYAQRWQIETLFAALKTRGFNLEDTHMTDPERISKLTAVLSITFCWAHKVGDWLHEAEPIRLKTHKRMAKSIFRYGFEWIRRQLVNPIDRRQAIELIRFLVPGKPPVQVPRPKPARVVYCGPRQERRAAHAGRPCPVFQREDVAQRNLPRGERQAFAALRPGMELPLQPAQTHLRPCRFRVAPRHDPTDHHLKGTGRRYTIAGSAACLNRIGTMSKYAPLRDYLASRPLQEWKVTFEDIEDVLGFPLPASARRYPAWWANESTSSHVQSHSWLDAGWRTSEVKLREERLTFIPIDVVDGHLSNPRDADVEEAHTLAGTNADAQRAYTITAKFDWKLAGSINLDWKQRLVFPPLGAGPGVYMFEVDTGSEIRVYIGEAENLRRRMQHYRTPGSSQKTNIRLNESLTETLKSKSLVTLWTIGAEAALTINEEKMSVNLSSQTERRLLESSALIVAKNGDAVILNH